MRRRTSAATGLGATKLAQVGTKGARYASYGLRAWDAAQNVRDEAGAVADMRENGLTLQNSIQLAGAGLATVGDLADAAGKLRRAADAVEEAADAVGEAASTAGKLQHAGDAVGPGRELPVLQEWCFAPETLVETPTGRRKIDGLQAGDEVLAYDFVRGRWAVQQVEQRHESYYRGAVVTLSTEEGEVTATAYHPFWVIESHDLESRPRPRELSDHEDEGLSLPGRWVNSHDLLPGDVLVTRDGRRLRLLKSVQRFEEDFRVCNMTIEEHHTFAVGAAAILVHNTSGCGHVGTSAPGGTELPILNPNFTPKPTTLGRVGEALAETTGW